MNKIWKDLLILFFLVFLVVFLWFSKGLLFAGGEEGITFYDINKTTQVISFVWQDVSAGFPIQLVLNRIPYFSFLTIFSLIGAPGFLVQAIHFFIIMAFGSVSLYFLLRETVIKELEVKSNIFKLVPLVGAIFYLLNPFSMTQVWGRGLYLQFFPFALFPFFLLMFIVGLRKRNFIFGFLGLLASFFFAGSFGNPSYIFSFWILIFIYLIFYIIKNRDKKNIFFSLIYFLFMIVGWIIVHMWWIYPFIKISSNQFALALNNTEVNVGTLSGISKDYRLHSLLRLIHEGYFYRDLKFGGSYPSFPFILLSWIIPLAALFSYKTFKKTKFFLFFSILFLFSLFICLGANYPTGPLFVLIFKTFPFFQAFRNPFEKFGIVLTIAYAPFFAIGSIVVSQWISRLFKGVDFKVFLFGILFLVCGIFLWPIWTGQFTAGGVKISPWVQAPNYYTDLDRWLNEQKDDGRIIHFPINPGDGLRYGGWEHPYYGIEPGEYIFTRPSIGKNGQSAKVFYNVLLERFNKFQPLAYGADPDITNSEFRSDNLSEELAKLNARYIILHKDIDPVVGNIGTWEPVEQYLKNQKNIIKINTFGKLDVYKVEIPEDIHLVYSPQLNLSYSRIDPTLYIVNVANATGPFDLHFLENFDSNWQAIVNGEEIKDHQKAFSYANSWKIEKTGNFSVIIKYKPQDFVNEGMKISLYAICLLGSICVIYFLRKAISKK